MRTACYKEDMENDKDHLAILLEDIQSDVKKVVETTDTHTRQLGRLEPIEETLGQLKVDVDAIKTTLVDLVGLRKEVTDLKKRVEQLEAKAG